MSGTNFSSRVKNMKFMQRVDNKLENVDKEQESKKLKDLSEWKLPVNSKTIKIAKSKRKKVRTVGYSAINSLNSKPIMLNTATDNIGRRILGGATNEVPIKRSIEDEEANKTKKKKGEFELGKQVEDDSDYEPEPSAKTKSLLQLWNNSNKSRNDRTNADKVIKKHKN